jgi:2-C-methyl-D-erythritol 4-phosphate cytidylyltransferase/2-C-methyl-D-erythritol 2,4-cyclodiphosphate synthase
MQTVALIVAAGKGERFGTSVPKQYACLGGIPILTRSIRAFVEHPRIGAVRVVISADDCERYQAVTRDMSLLEPVVGGATRQETVRQGLESLAALAPEQVLIHDAARPLVSAGVIDRVIDALDRFPAALPVIPVVDTLKRLADAEVVGEVDRRGLGRAQTPQGFRYEAILDAHRTVGGTGYTDDTAIAAAVGLAVAWVVGEERNLKLTVPEDHMMAERLLGSAPRWRTGLGFDVHAFAPDRPLVLCGVRIPHELGLAGHSDADAAFHAVTDAILGTIAAGDIGSHFPPGDDRWRDADSAVFLRHAVDLLAAKGGRIENVDLVIVCERPKIGPFREAMARRAAEVLGIPADRIGIKATTSERMGFTGRGEGIAAQAVVSVAMGD